MTEDYKKLTLGLAAGVAIGGGLMGSLWWLRERKAKEWSKKEIKTNMVDMIGYTPVLKLKSLSQALGNEIFIKLENSNPSRSIKDRTVWHIIHDMIEVKRLELDERGKIVNGQKYTYYEASSGNAGIALCLLSCYFGIKANVCVPDCTTNSKCQAIEACGGILHKVPPADIDDENHVIKMPAKLARVDPHGHFGSQWSNPAPIHGHYHQTGQEIYEQMDGKLDVFVHGLGTGSTFNGISNFLKTTFKNKITNVLTDSNSMKLSTYFKKGKFETPLSEEDTDDESSRKPLIEGISFDWLSDNILGSKVDDVECASNQEAYLMAKYILTHEGILIGSPAAANLVALVKHCLRQSLKNKRLLTLWNDDGFRHVNRFYNLDQWKKEGIECPQLVDISSLDNFNWLKL